MSIRKKPPLNLSMDPDTKNLARRMAKAHGLSLSAYVASLINGDCLSHGIQLPGLPTSPLPTHENKLHEGQFVMKDPAIESRRKTLKKSK